MYTTPIPPNNKSRATKDALKNIMKMKEKLQELVYRRRKEYQKLQEKAKKHIAKQG